MRRLIWNCKQVECSQGVTNTSSRMNRSRCWRRYWSPRVNLGFLCSSLHIQYQCQQLWDCLYTDAGVLDDNCLCSCTPGLELGVFFFRFFFFSLSGSYCVCEALRAGMWETVVIKVFCNSIKDSPPPSAPTALPSYTYSLLQELCSPASAAWAPGLCCLTNVRTGCVENGGFVTWKCAGKRVYEVEKKTVKWNKWGIAVPQRAANVVSTQRWDTHYGRESFFIGCYQVTVHRRWMDDNYVDENLTYPYWQE